MADPVAPEYERFINDERRAQRLPSLRPQLKEGELAHPVVVDGGTATEFLQIAARRAAGLIRPTRRTEVVWVDGDRELAVVFAKMRLVLGDGLLRVMIPIRCDQTGDAIVEVPFAVGSPERPAGLFASTFRRPIGPPVVVAAWGEALVAFAWQCVLGMITGVAGATGKDRRGNILVPVELAVTARTVEILPMARFRFAGSSGLRATKRGSAPR
jgi:hypothetical protein